MFRYARIKVSPSGEIFTQFVDLTQEDVLNRASGEFVPSMMSGKSVSDLFISTF
jgi:hypothetical protein